MRFPRALEPVQGIGIFSNGPEQRPDQGVHEGKVSETPGNPEKEKAGTEKKKNTYLVSFPSLMSLYLLPLGNQLKQR